MSLARIGAPKGTLAMARLPSVRASVVAVLVCVGAGSVASVSGAEMPEPVVLAPVRAIASTEYSGNVGASHLIDPGRLDEENRHIGTIWGGNWLAADSWRTRDNWV